VEVNTTFTLQSIIDFDTTGQRIDVMGFFTVSWYDEEMIWDPADYNDTKYIKLPLNTIWYPKLGISKVNNYHSQQILEQLLANTKHASQIQKV
jgi:hypothetical protein